MISSTMLSRQMLNIQKVTRIHFYLLAILLFNYVLRQVTGFGLNIYLIDLLKGILYLTGIFLFLMCLKPLKIIAAYYFLYILTPTVVAALYLGGGIFLAIFSSLLLAPVMPVQPDYNDGNVKVYSEFNGFMGPCCRYYASQNRLYLFEQFKGNISIGKRIDFEKAKITLENDSALISSDTVYRVKLN